MKKAHCKRDGAIGEQWQRLVEAIEASFEGMFVLDTVFYWQNSLCVCVREIFLILYIIISGPHHHQSNEDFGRFG